MGFGLPAAIGAKVAMPDQQVVCLAGDGSLIMVCQEFATAAANNLPVKVFLMNNGHFGMVRQWQELFWEERYKSVVMGPSPDWVEARRGLRLDRDALRPQGRPPRRDEDGARDRRARSCSTCASPRTRTATR